MLEQKTMSPRAWAELAVLGFIWGASFLSIRIALDEVPVLTVVAHRIFWAALILWGIVWYRGYALPKDWHIWLAFLCMGALNNILPFTLMAWGQLYIESGLTSILNAATAIFGVIVAAIVFADERLTAQKSMGVGLGFLGVALIIGIDALLSFDIRSLAQFAILAGTISYACAGAFARARLSHLPPVLAAAGMLTGSSLVMVPLAWSVDGAPQFDLAPITLAAIGYYTVIATAGAYILYYRVLATAGSGNLMVCTLLIPPVAIVLGAVVRGEALSANAYAGLTILALGLLVLDGRILRRRTRAARN